MMYQMGEQRASAAGGVCYQRCLVDDEESVALLVGGKEETGVGRVGGVAAIYPFVDGGGGMPGESLRHFRRSARRGEEHDRTAQLVESLDECAYDRSLSRARVSVEHERQPRVRGKHERLQSLQKESLPGKQFERKFGCGEVCYNIFPRFCHLIYSRLTDVRKKFKSVQYVKLLKFD